MVCGSSTLVPVSDLGSKTEPNFYEERDSGPRSPWKLIIQLLLVGATRLRAGGGGSGALPTRSVSFQSSSVSWPSSTSPPLGISRQGEYELLSRARSHVKFHGESGTQSSAGNESFGEPTESTPGLR